MPDDPRACWDELVQYVLGEYVANHRTAVSNFHHDFEQRTLRLRVLGPCADWVERAVTDEQLRFGDLRAIAAGIYAETLWA